MFFAPFVGLIGRIPFILAFSFPTMAISDRSNEDRLVFCHFMARNPGIISCVVNAVLTLLRLASLATAKALATMTMI